MEYIIGWVAIVFTITNYFLLTTFKDYKRRTYYTVTILPCTLSSISCVMLESWIPLINNLFAVFISLYFLITHKNLKVNMSKQLFDIGLYSIVAVACASLFVSTSTGADIFAFSAAYIFAIGYLLYCGNAFNNLEYFLYNAYAGVAIIPSLYFDENWPLVGLNIFWLILSLRGYYREKQEYKRQRIKVV